MNEIELLQKHLLLIRRSLGWTAVEFGDKIGVTRQTINNLEANDPKKARMSKTQYLAIRKVLDDEIKNSPEDTAMVESLLEILIDHPDKYPSEEREQVVAKAGMLAPAILAKSSTRNDVSKDWSALLGSGLLGAVVGGLFSPIAAPLAIGGIAALGNAVLNKKKKEGK